MTVARPTYLNDLESCRRCGAELLIAVPLRRGAARGIPRAFCCTKWQMWP